MYSRAPSNLCGETIRRRRSNLSACGAVLRDDATLRYMHRILRVYTLPNVRNNDEFWLSAYAPTSNWAIQNREPVERSTANGIPQLILDVCASIIHLSLDINVFRRSQTPSLPLAIRVRVDRRTVPRTARYVANARVIALYHNYFSLRIHLASNIVGHTRGRADEGLDSSRSEMGYRHA